MDIDFILICETFLTDNIADMYQIPGYKFIHKSRSVRRGGVGIYIRDYINFKLRDDIALFHQGQFSIFIETSHTQNPTIIGEIYRIPNTNEQLSLDRFESILNKLDQCNKDIIIGTDQNFDYLKINTHSNTADLLNHFFSRGLVPCITKPTRITHTSATLIDNFYVNPQRETKLHSGIIFYELADHLPIFLCSGKAPKRKNRDPLIFKHRQVNANVLHNITNVLSETDWTHLLDVNVNQAFLNFSDKLSDTMNYFAPEKIIKIPYKFVIRDPWVTKGIMKSSNKLDCLRQN
jgi:hypothetical protein